MIKKYHHDGADLTRKCGLFCYVIKKGANSQNKRKVRLRPVKDSVYAACMYFVDLNVNY